MFTQRVGKRLRIIRIEQDVKQRDLALRVGLSPSVLSDIERGYRAPTDRQVEAIAAALGIPPESLHGDAA